VKKSDGKKGSKSTREGGFGDFNSKRPEPGGFKAVPLGKTFNRGGANIRPTGGECQPARDWGKRKEKLALLPGRKGKRISQQNGGKKGRIYGGGGGTVRAKETGNVKPQKEEKRCKHRVGGRVVKSGNSISGEALELVLPEEGGGSSNQKQNQGRIGEKVARKRELI